MVFSLLELSALRVTPGIREENEDLISCHPSLFPWAQKKWMCESWCGMLLAASPSAGQTGVWGKNPCHTVSEEADLKFMSAREEQKCKPHLGSALKAEGPHPLEAENPHHKALKNARKPCSTQALMGKGGYRPALGLCH